MKLDAAYLNDAAKQTGFDPHNIEKVLRLKELLREFLRHPFLKGKLVLKGGTGINVFLLELPRLSVDIDLNYIGQIDRDRMQTERPEVERAVEQIALGLGYRTHGGKNDWALTEFHLSFNNHAKRADHLQVEVNFLMRICALPPHSRKAIQLADEAPCESPVLAIEELMAGKLKAMIERSHPRDLYDLYRFSQAGVNYDSEMLTKLTVLFGSTLAHDLRSYTLDRYDHVKTEDIERLLYPLLRSWDRPTTKDMTAAIRPLIGRVLARAKEKTYLDAMARGEYRPELLFPNRPDIVERIARHPALLWKAANVAEHRSRQRQAR
ncbi:MAG: nucleotidyl transferase AbiEii/AbiGii toxin family protein [Terriglobia bacterium]